jgi:hypothetical protein
MPTLDAPTDSTPTGRPVGMPALAKPAPRTGGVLAWAAYLACSWTWCIGMCLPVLLIRDFGVWSFAVFALPNVVGAAAMGFVLSRQGQSERLVREHAGAMRLFGLVTVAFQCFLLGWILTALGWGSKGFWAGAGGLGVLAAIVYAVFALARRRDAWPLAATVLLLVSLGVGFWLISNLGPPRFPEPARPPTDLFWLAPVCVLGFALCPYLDLTFHRARASLPAGKSRAAFGIGFGVLFFSMIVVTLLYARVLLEKGPQPAPLGPPLVVGAVVFLLLTVHLIGQLVFTARVHGAELARTGRPLGLRRGPGLTLAAVVLPMALGFVLAGPGHAWAYADLSLSELAYRGFLAFYGLVFPAYVWVCMIPSAGQARGPTPDKVRAVVLAIAAAAPFYWLGFMERQTVWLVPGVAIVVLSRLLVPRRVGA